MLSEPLAQLSAWPTLDSVCLSVTGQADMEGRVDAQSLDYTLGYRALVLRQQADTEIAGAAEPLSDVNIGGHLSSFSHRASCF